MKSRVKLPVVHAEISAARRRGPLEVANVGRAILVHQVRKALRVRQVRRLGERLLFLYFLSRVLLFGGLGKRRRLDASLYLPHLRVELPDLRLDFESLLVENVPLAFRRGPFFHFLFVLLFFLRFCGFRNVLGFSIFVEMELEFGQTRGQPVLIPRLFDRPRGLSLEVEVFQLPLLQFLLEFGAHAVVHRVQEKVAFVVIVVLIIFEFDGKLVSPELLHANVR